MVRPANLTSFLRRSVVMVGERDAGRPEVSSPSMAMWPVIMESTLSAK